MLLAALNLSVTKAIIHKIIFILTPEFYDLYIIIFIVNEAAQKLDIAAPLISPYTNKLRKH